MQNRNFRLLAQLTWVLGAALLCSALSSLVWERVLTPSAMGFLVAQLIGCAVVGLIAFRLGSRYARAEPSGTMDRAQSAGTRKRRRQAHRSTHSAKEGRGQPRSDRKAGSAASGKRKEHEKQRPQREEKHETLTGTLKFYQSDSQYGFIEREGELDLYFGAEGLAEGVEQSALVRGAAISYWIGPGRRGPAAYDVQPISKATQD